MATVYLPPETMDRCSACGQSTNLHFCSGCKEKFYCSKDCQLNHWSQHKAECGKTDHIDLYTIYPFFATLMDASHQHPDRPTHMGLIQRILNSPNPGTPATRLRDGSYAQLVVLGEELPTFDPEQWWPSAESTSVRVKLFSRILRDGFLLPNITAVCMALLAKMYTTNSAPRCSQRRIRLRYNSTPIADFGIAKGRVEGVPDRCRLVFLDLPEQNLAAEQTPEDHYWMYFTTVKNDEIFLDCGMYPFNFGKVVQSSTYAVNSLPHLNWAPAVFWDKAVIRNAVQMHYPTRRFSVLRNTNLHRAVRNSGSGRTGGFEDADRQLIWNFMDQVAGRQCQWPERYLAMAWTVQDCNALSYVLANETWKEWPDNPVLAGDGDPGEQFEPTEAQRPHMGGMVRLNRRFNRGEITRDEWQEGIEAWGRRSQRI